MDILRDSFGLASEVIATALESLSWMLEPLLETAQSGGGEMCVFMYVHYTCTCALIHVPVILSIQIHVQYTQ